MAAVSVTASSVIPQANAITTKGIAGESVTAGQVLYYKPGDTRWWKADATDLEKAGSATNANIRIVLCNAAAGQPVELLEPNQSATYNAIFTKGKWYYLSPSAGAGGICLEADLGSGNFGTLLGQATSTTVLLFDPWVGVSI